MYPFQNPETRYYVRRLERLSSLSLIVEETLASRLNQLDIDVSAVAETMMGESREEYIEWHSEDFFILADELPSMMRYSIMVGAESALEAYIGKTCDSFATQTAARLKPTDLSGSGIDRMRDYLKKVANMPFPDGGTEWITMKNLRKIRNAFVHADGLVLADREAVRVWSQGFDGLQISDAGTVTLTEDFSQRIISTYQRFGELFDAACERVPLVPEFSVLSVEDQATMPKVVS
jgi:hypothetical protein